MGIMNDLEAVDNYIEQSRDLKYKKPLHENCDGFFVYIREWKSLMNF